MNFKEQLDEILKKYNPKNYGKIIKSKSDLYKWLKDQTKHQTTSSTSINELLFLYKNPYFIPICTKGNKKKFISINKGFANCGPANVCECTRNQIQKNTKNTKSKLSTDDKKIINEKRKQTCLLKFGATTNLITDETKQKIKQTNLNKYGVDNPSKSREIKQSMYNTNFEKYGVKNVFQSSVIKTKIKQTILRKYGVDHPMKYERFKEKRKQTNLKKYGTINPTSLDFVKEKIKQTNLKKYGVEFISQKRISFHLKDILQNSDWLQFQHQTNSKPIYALAQEIGVSPSYLQKTFHQANISIIRFPQSLQEKEILDFLKQNFDYNIKTNDRIEISPLELDIFIPEKKLAIEYCGLHWHSQFSGNKKPNYHLNKLKLCLEKNIRLITIFSDEWENKKEIVKNRLKHVLGFSEKKSSARETEIRVISNELYKSFVDQYHIQGSIPTKIKLGAFYNNQLVAAMGLGARRRSLGVNKKDFNDYEILRFCTSGNIPGIGSKLFKYFVNVYSPKKIVSYADRRWGEGEFYRHLGFEFVSSTPPSYFYTNDYKKRHNRFAFRKDVIVREMGGDPNKTEWENMQNFGYDRIWDCGTNKWVWNK